ncbi:NAD-dependent SIR2 family protein deacetylase [Kushneria sinocarnis]|uniref:protein acetyllysine N-acetyltransferase n=1 Tax=Kushneria sinocarnis TaxID=595502 RepID=A0A420WW30_9GAMM|nr:NAD-dependent protein deacetylase [Kushneria sinocarnis]RKR03321.1 NAD-dependent SIR2 family protein deacetylase [Kushneria sinocarnis]
MKHQPVRPDAGDEDAASRDRTLAVLAEQVQGRRLCVLTGAGISTASGIPDYRDESGAWKRPQPMSHQSYMSSEWARRRYWARSLVGYRLLAGAQPGAAHRELAELERRGHIEGVITQNVDRLHQKAGSRRVIDLHGRADLVRCMQCNLLIKRDALHEHLGALNPDWVNMEAEVAPDGDAYLEEVDFSRFRLAACPRCESGILKPDVVFFGDNVSHPRLGRAMGMLERADALLVIGSSLMVFSGYRFARHAARLAMPIFCFNRGRTRADALFTLKHDRIDEGLATLLTVMRPGG